MYITQPTDPVPLTNTLKTIREHIASQRPILRARIGLTLVHVALTTGSRKTWGASALKRVYPVDAGSPVETWVRNTLVPVQLAEHSFRAVWTGTLEIVDEVVTRSAIHARQRRAFVDVVLAVEALVAVSALADEAPIAH